MLLASSCGALRSRGDSYDCRNQKAMSHNSAPSPRLSAIGILSVTAM
jgi:hypothetical protein